ncbi:hypothetical protein J4050_06805 [Winogradskyella sp. DF17]|uniref:Lipocalin-like domain-containing protein n=1 Tax=Winogradskyella pelagia TaxID=2819984 RepID=A0ABS3T1X9_9FLAO|nr:hypothetical protein [Winogradskyella sp. DF17]MBO3116449.1 hypothetical protein [Winogradskyella sp. DF17]
MKLHYYIIILSSLLLSSCVQKTPQKTITVILDMTTLENPRQVGIRGEYPLSWEETTYLEDTNGDKIYEGEFTIYTANNGIEFKFVNNNNQFELTDQPNRSLSFEYKPETIIYKAKFDTKEYTTITRN